MNNKNIIKTIYLLLFILIISQSCSVKEEIKDKITKSVVQSDPNLLPNVVAPALGQLRNLWWRQSVWGFQEATSDECFFPTRGTDWFDGGVWVADYTLTWTPMHRDVEGTWNGLNTAISSANTALNILGLPKTNEDASFGFYRAQVIFLRTFYEYNLYDLYRTYPVRDPFNLDFSIAPQIFTGKAGFDRLISVIKTTMPQMKTRENALYGEPNQDACLMLLAKLYLNKEIYTGAAAYDSCLIYLNQLIATAHYGLATNYFGIFSVDNDKNYKTATDEGILVAVFDDDQNYGGDDNVQWVKTAFHYNQTLGSTFSNWNGCCVPQGYLLNTWIAGTDTSTDVRWKNNSIKQAMGVNLGFNYGQQYDPKTLKALQDRNGKPLNFTFDCPLSGAKEYQGVRVLKYPPRVIPINAARTPNDFIIWRYSDALLMQAECLVRANGDFTGALAIVNNLRTIRHAPAITASSNDDMLNKILIERGLELYWEGHRRQDMIRFGTYLNSRMEWPAGTVVDSKALLLPIPASAIAGTPSGVLKQNPGY